MKKRSRVPKFAQLSKEVPKFAHPHKTTIVAIDRGVSSLRVSYTQDPKLKDTHARLSKVKTGAIPAIE